jgi:hypothetical protein
MNLEPRTDETKLKEFTKAEKKKKMEVTSTEVYLKKILHPSFLQCTRVRYVNCLCHRSAGKYDEDFINWNKFVTKDKIPPCHCVKMFSDFFDDKLKITVVASLFVNEDLGQEVMEGEALEFIPCPEALTDRIREYINKDALCSQPLPPPIMGCCLLLRMPNEYVMFSVINFHFLFLLIREIDSFLDAKWSTIFLL